MENLFFRLRRYLNYPADTNGKVVEIWQRMRALMENFQIKVEGLENKIGLLQSELNNLRDHVQNDLRNHAQNEFNRMHDRLQTIEQREQLATPWLPMEGKLDDNHEFLLLTHLVNFFPKPIALDVGANKGALSEVFLDAGYEVYAFEPFPPAMKKLGQRLGDRPGLHLMEMAVGSGDTTLTLHIAEGGRQATRDDPSGFYNFRPHLLGPNLAFTRQMQLPARTLTTLPAPEEISD